MKLIWTDAHFDGGQIATYGHFTYRAWHRFAEISWKPTSKANCMSIRHFGNINYLKRICQRHHDATQS